MSSEGRAQAPEVTARNLTYVRVHCTPDRRFRLAEIHGQIWRGDSHLHLSASPRALAEITFSG